MSKPLIASLVFHAAVIIIGTLGLPYIKKDIEIATPIPIELVPVSDITQTNKPAEREQAAKEEKPEPAKPEPERPKQAPTQKSEAPPRPVPPPQEELVEPKKEPVKKVEPEKPKEKPKPPEKPRPVQAKEPEKPQEDPFQSLLKNLQEQKPEPSTEQGTATTPQKATPAPLGETITMSEIDALRQQLSQCWQVLAGARYAEDLVVDMKLYVNPDRTVRMATVVDLARYNSDSIFRAAADSAMRAVRSPDCSPLRLPPDKYEQWKDIVVRFDPSQIL